MEACAEAVAILEEGYQAPRGQGYYAAFLDASNPNLNGLEYVLAQMAGYITVDGENETHQMGLCQPDGAGRLAYKVSDC